jgi:hypothetical protein
MSGVILKPSRDRSSSNAPINPTAANAGLTPSVLAERIVFVTDAVLAAFPVGLRRPLPRWWILG